ncbi:GTPase activating protein 1-like [Typha latifolia]|uniref:GTPase activating protein 1-like n=1 Tax=Typha latifolia TaxID=4733 RepID=UPI003C309106
MDHFAGLLKIKVVRGVNLAYRDSRGSDPYVVVRLGAQRLKTGVKKKNVNPVWNEDLTLSIDDPFMPIKIEVFDKDTFTKDDSMGDAEFSIHPLVEAAKMNLEGLPSTAVIKTVNASRQNCIASDSHIILKDGKLVQDVILRLRNTESGEVELQLQWVNIPRNVP